MKVIMINTTDLLYLALNAALDELQSHFRTQNGTSTRNQYDKPTGVWT